MAHDFTIPQHKRLTGKAKLEEESRRAVKVHMQAVCADRLMLLAIVTGGKEHYRGIAGKAFKGFLVDSAMIDQMFGFFVEQAGPDPVRQYDELQQAELVNLKLEKLQGLARMISDEKHLDRVLDLHVPNPVERAAIRSQMLVLIKAHTVLQ